MKRILAVLLVLAMALSMMAGCGASEPSAPAETPASSNAPASSDAPAEAAKGPFKVASHNAQIEGNPYRSVYEDQMKLAVKGYQSDGVISDFNSYTSNMDPAVQSQQIEQTINEGFDIIMVNPIAATGLDPVIDKAVEAGITYINADCEYNSSKIINVTVDQREWAKLNADFVVKTLGQGKKVVLFNGIDGNSASEIRNEVYQKILKENNMEIVKTFAHGWDDVQAEQQMAEVISSGVKYDGILNQEGANGIMNAIEKANVGYPGCITSSEEVSWIRRVADINKNELVMPFIVTENPPGVGATALAVALNLKMGGELKEEVVNGEFNNILVPPIWQMTYDNMAERLEEIKDLPNTTSVSSYFTLDQARAAYFK
ncbi:substrate-binding domain-containing protein [Hydrogenoanaerobacterium sp.]|uniref:substrate-binding domain-containing protein n=1 Tax=Hydrogenoanaerobacterium sp. TaxID=2953763 RepID=UPI0028991154|nr:substrate-binding domain-containing protein [Hydrogenoanaerobacterium sp.]